MNGEAKSGYVFLIFEWKRPIGTGHTEKNKFKRKCKTELLGNIKIKEI